jgi:hypothetical protein
LKFYDKIYGTMSFQIKAKIIVVLALLIIVIGEGSLLLVDHVAKRLPNAPKECFEKASEYNKWLCFRPYFEELVYKVSPRYAMTEVKIFKEKEIIDDCHLNAHFIGEAALEKYDFDVGKAFVSCEFGCIEGCFHGVMERFVRYEADPYSVVSKVKGMCDSVSSPNRQIESLLKSQCAHGIGHGLVAHNFLPIADALIACRESAAEFRCIGGVTMEHVEQYLALEENEFEEILPEVCAPFEELNDLDAIQICMGNIGVAVMWYTKHDLELSKKLCENLEKSEYVNICKNGAEEEEITNLAG